MDEDQIPNLVGANNVVLVGLFDVLDQYLQHFADHLGFKLELDDRQRVVVKFDSPISDVEEAKHVVNALSTFNVEILVR